MDLTGGSPECDAPLSLGSKSSRGELDMLRKTGPGKIEEREATSPITRALLYNFDFDGDALKPEHATWLETFVVPSLYMPQYRVWMRGTASKVGNNVHNFELSRRRVKSVESHLVGMGVDRSQIQAEWAGEEISRSTLADDERDRAVEIHLQAEIVPPPPPPPTPPPPPAGQFSLPDSPAGLSASRKGDQPGEGNGPRLEAGEA